MKLTPLPTIPGIVADHDQLMVFFEYILERQRMWHKRFVLKEPGPWTTDPVLNEWKFTNVSRYLDRGTVYFLDYLDKTPEATVEDIVWNSLFYRMINNMSCHKECGGFTSWADWDYDTWYNKLRERHKRGDQVLCQSHNTCAHTSAPGADKIERVCLILKQAHNQVKGVVAGLERSQKPEEAFEVIRKLYGYGEFLAYEVWCDMSYTDIIPWTENAWTNAGPGAARGLNRIFSSNLPVIRNPEQLRQLIFWLRDNQRFYFNLVCDEDAFVKVSHNWSDFNTRASEHSLCEYSKLAKLRAKTGTSFSGRYRTQEHKQLVDLDYSLLERFPKIV